MDAYDNGKAISLRTTGSGGKELVFYNGFLAPHEDNVQSMDLILAGSMGVVGVV